MLSIPEINNVSIDFEMHMFLQKHSLVGGYFPNKYQLHVCLLYYFFIYACVTVKRGRVQVNKIIIW